MNWQEQWNETKEQRYVRWIMEQEELARQRSKEQFEMREEMLKECHVYFKNPEPSLAVICIPGRGNDGAVFANDYYTDCDIENAIFIGPTPHGYAWYPMPHDANNQSAALNGIPRAINAIEAVQKAVQKRFNLSKSQTVLTGFSAGGVMAIQTAAYSEEPYAGVVCHSGAILEPNDLPRCVPSNDCPILLTHNEDDYCFDWVERYLPMRESLRDKSWRVSTLERKNGGHVVSKSDIIASAEFINKKIL